MFLTLSDGEEIKVDSVIVVSPLIGSGLQAYYEIYFIGGHHEVIKEADMPREDFLALWKSV